MKLSLFAYRRMVFLDVIILVAVVLVLAVGVIGPVKDEVARGGTPQMALNAFWINIGLSLLAAVVLFVIAMRSKGRSWVTTTGHIVATIVVLLLGLALADAASAYKSHGPEMQTATIILFICAAADLLAGLHVFITAFLQPKKA
jgi:hypothetical protein